MKTATLSFFAAFVISAALLSACFNPAGVTTDASTPEALPEEAAGTGGTAAGIQDSASFTVTIPVGSAGRAVAGIGETGIKTGGARNTYLLVALDSATKKIVRSWEGNKEEPDDTSATLDDVILPAGTYDFLLLMGHRERNYTAEGDDPAACIYKAGAPTLLAAGYAAEESLPSETSITITMNAVTVTAQFSGTPGTVNTVEDLAVGFKLGAAADWTLTWTVSGLANLESALPEDTDPSYLFKAVRGQAWQTGGSYATLSTNAGFDNGESTDTVTLNLGAPPAGVPCAAWFNLEYAPFSLTGWSGQPWVIRNGINDLPQDDKTDFSLSGDKIQWGAAKNGNGAVRFTVAAPTVTDRELSPYLSAPVTGNPPDKAVAGSVQYIGAVTWSVTGGGSHTGNFKANTTYTATAALVPYPGSGYTFDGIPASTDDGSFTYAMDGVTVGHNAGSTAANGPLSVTITFPKTAALTKVKDLDLTDKVLAPVGGGTPVTSFSVPQYEGEVVWKYKNNDDAEENFTGNKFEATTEYTAVVTLTAATDRTFDGIPENKNNDPVTDTFSHDDGEVTHDAGKADTQLTVTIKFPAAEVETTVKPGDGWGVYINTN